MYNVYVHVRKRLGASDTQIEITIAALTLGKPYVDRATPDIVAGSFPLLLGKVVEERESQV